jgi:hypothetical protein
VALSPPRIGSACALGGSVIDLLDGAQNIGVGGCTDAAGHLKDVLSAQESRYPAVALATARWTHRRRSDSADLFRRFDVTL